MTFCVLGDRELPIVSACATLLENKDQSLVPGLSGADAGIAPLLTQKLTQDDIAKTKHGVLIFHPSLLPRHRGRDSIKWAFKLGESYTGATWFWATEGLDTGDICEQEVLAILPDERPREFYERAVIPSALRMLGFIVDDLRRGVVRRRPQQHENATFEPGIKKTEPPPIVS
jgi:methionyl-tRNA formyltransferase